MVVEGDMAVGIDGVVPVYQPIADIYVGGFVAIRGSDFFDQGGMAVAEDAVVESICGKALTAVQDYAFAVVALVFEYFWFAAHTGAALLLAPARGNAESHPFGQKG